MAQDRPPLGPQPTSVVPHYAPAPGVATAPPTNTLAIVSLVAGIASYVIFPVIGAVIAVITGHMALRQIKATGEGGRGFAIGGLVLGYLHLALGVLILLIVMVVLFGFLGLAAVHH